MPAEIPLATKDTATPISRDDFKTKFFDNLSHKKLVSRETIEAVGKPPYYQVPQELRKPRPA